MVVDARAVLVVEDDESIRHLLTTIVADETGRPVVAARDGAEALIRAREAPPALVILDLMLPRVDGFDVARELRADPATADCVIVAISAAERAESALAAGCDLFISKPFELDELMLTVEVSLGRIPAALDIAHALEKLPAGN